MSEQDDGEIDRCETDGCHRDGVVSVTWGRGDPGETVLRDLCAPCYRMLVEGRGAVDIFVIDGGIDA